MAEEELNLDLDENNNEELTREQSRNKKLSEKVKEALAEKEAARAEAEKLKAEREALAKEASFYKDFAKASTKYQSATDYQDKIWEKVKSGYSVDDATVSTLVAEGKYTPPPQPEVKETVAGGSASIGITDKGDKPVSEMTLEEKRAILATKTTSELFGR